MVSIQKGRLILGILFLCVVGLGVEIWYKLQSPSSVNPSTPVFSLPPERPPEQIRAEWKQGVETTLAAYDQDKNAIKARDALLKLSVTTQEKSVHLQLVLAFQALIDKNPPAGGPAASDLQKARQNFSSVLKIP